jgi:hypothetical protein
MQFYLDEKDPLSGDWDDVPVDLSFIYEDEKPAGRHSFLRVKEDKFVLAITDSSLYYCLSKVNKKNNLFVLSMPKIQ